VVWLEAGRIRARGTHAELWRDPAYRAVFAADAAQTDAWDTGARETGGDVDDERSRGRDAGHRGA
jgi:ATP-binding cassette subfamily B protein